MNAGAASARGSVLIFTDDDVVADRGWAETLRAFLAERSSGLVVAGGPILPIADDLGAMASMARLGSPGRSRRPRLGSGRTRSRKE
jgi:hypothetical protein